MKKKSIIIIQFRIKLFHLSDNKKKKKQLIRGKVMDSKFYRVHDYEDKFIHLRYRAIRVRVILKLITDSY